MIWCELVSLGKVSFGIEKKKVPTALGPLDRDPRSALYIEVQVPLSALRKLEVKETK